ncbi:MSC_0619 family F1-like ATPase alpha subunit [Mycoplasmopsis columboralis]|uniref:ATP synthase F0F1 subunit alpha n=1 Tax=Mycoplasmopsis columboralis TaxID=171282 RepID=A0A449B6F9_9BACT|nr:ATP F0F1 synthase subunit alpha [Mycoplasmopsis columboralis]VEU76142.1 ATP synthase F0F1 subunit alpha [Mycoplasmopsis columboralis]
MTNKLQITSVNDYIVEISGSHNFAQGEFLALKDNPHVQFMVISAKENSAYCLGVNNSVKYAVGSEVTTSVRSSLVKTSLEYFGKVIDVHGNVLYPTKTAAPKNFLTHQSQTISAENHLMNYELLEEQLKTGYAIIDLLIPIGKGQRELIIGDRQTGKSFIALNTIINQKNKNIKCIYVAIGQTQNQVSWVYQTLKENDALDYTMIINAPAETPFEQYLAPYVGMAHAENLSYEDDVLIVFDDLTKHANVYREIALLTNKPIGKEAYPGDMFYAHARLLERSGKFKNRKSITALPILQTIDNDITSLIASNVISITDGQIVTSSELFALNKYPAINIDLSVSRIGTKLQNPITAQTTKTINTIYRAFKRQTKLAALKYDLNEEVNNLIISGIQIEKLFNQKGISSYDSMDLFLTAQIIKYNILNNLKDKEIQQAIEFLIAFAKEDQVSIQMVNNLINNSLSDKNAPRDYFAFVLHSYSNMFNLNWNIALSKEYLNLNQSLITKIHKQLTGGK